MTQKRLPHLLSKTGILVALLLLTLSFTWAQAKAKVLYRFQGGTVDGQYPSGQLLVASDGSLYGTTPYGGGLGTCGYNGYVAYCGTIFQLTPNANGSWKENLLYR